MSNRGDKVVLRLSKISTKKYKSYTVVFNVRCMYLLGYWSSLYMCARVSIRALGIDIASVYPIGFWNCSGGSTFCLSFYLDKTRRDRLFFSNPHTYQWSLQVSHNIST